MAFFILVLIVGFVGGGVAAIAGFGIGSLLTPLLLFKTDMKIAVAAVALPHVIGTGLRLWLLREYIDKHVLLSFGIMSAAGGLIGALLHSSANNPALTVLFSVLLIFAGVMGVTGLARRIKFKGFLSWIAGAISGVFGGLIGNQGGIRSAAMLGLGIEKNSFVATATAIALMVDAARIPVYLYNSALGLWDIRSYVLCAIIGVASGTLWGGRLLRSIPDNVFFRLVSAIILALGIWLLLKS